MLSTSLGQIFANYIRPMLDILLLAFILYKAYELLILTQAMKLIRGFLIIVAIYITAYFLNLSTLLWLLTLLAPGLIIAVAIIFQPELRKIFIKLGLGSFFSRRQGGSAPSIDSVLNAAEGLSTRRRGALMVFSRRNNLKSYADTGTHLDSLVSSSLISTIFSHDTSLHDGALIFQDGRALAAGCYFPLSEQQDIRKSFGARHRAALGLSEVTDAIILIVSEETGALSLAYDSRLYYDLTLDVIRSRLGELLGNLELATIASQDRSIEE